MDSETNSHLEEKSGLLIEKDFIVDKQKGSGKELER